MAKSVFQVTRLLDELNIGHADGGYQKQLLQLSKKELLILGDWGMGKLNTRQASDLLEVMEDRYQRGSTVIISQLPVSYWYKLVGNGVIGKRIALITLAPIFLLCPVRSTPGLCTFSTW